VLRWARRMLDLLQRADCANVDPQRLLAKYGWLTEYAAAIGEWSQFQRKFQAPNDLILFMNYS